MLALLLKRDFYIMTRHFCSQLWQTYLRSCLHCQSYLRQSISPAPTVSKDQKTKSPRNQLVFNRKSHQESGTREKKWIRREIIMILNTVNRKEYIMKRNVNDRLWAVQHTIILSFFCQKRKTISRYISNSGSNGRNRHSSSISVAATSATYNSYFRCWSGWVELRGWILNLAPA